MYYQFVEDYLMHEDRLNLHKNLPLIDKPVLLIHAKDDEVVSLKNAQKAHELIKHAILVEFDHGGHTFGAKASMGKR
jgi:pimeloyl-ACP methyl ester carboxylesterase